jgi:hypothetical protein
VFTELTGDVDHEYFDESGKPADDFFYPQNFPLGAKIIFSLGEVGFNSSQQTGHFYSKPFQEDELIVFQAAFLSNSFSTIR